ncbi:MAG TPA: hypothetical protein VFU98_00520, partial [Microlunatus sp.]|nr:hypothetical protein [Microlunatus sp.]
MLGGAVCTLGALSLGVGVAHADDQKDPLLGLETTVKVAAQHGKANKATDSSKKHARRAAVKAEVNVSLGNHRTSSRAAKPRASAKVQLGSSRNSESKSSTSRPRAAVKVDVNTGKAGQGQADRP